MMKKSNNTRNNFLFCYTVFIFSEKDVKIDKKAKEVSSKLLDKKEIKGEKIIVKEVAASGRVNLMNCQSYLLDLNLLKFIN